MKDKEELHLNPYFQVPIASFDEHNTYGEKYVLVVHAQYEMYQPLQGINGISRLFCHMLACAGLLYRKNKTLDRNFDQDGNKQSM